MSPDLHLLSQVMANSDAIGVVIAIALWSYILGVLCGLLQRRSR